MKLHMAALCDRATIREGLLHILGAGVTQCSLILPGPPDLDLALLIRAESWRELAGRHSLATTVTHENGTAAGSVEMSWEAPEIDPASQQDKPMPQLPIVVPIRSIALTEEGRHHVRIDIDGQEMFTVEFVATKAALPGVTVQLR